MGISSQRVVPALYLVVLELPRRSILSAAMRINWLLNPLDGEEICLNGRDGDRSAFHYSVFIPHKRSEWSWWWTPPFLSSLSIPLSLSHNLSPSLSPAVSRRPGIASNQRDEGVRRGDNNPPRYTVLWRADYRLLPANHQKVCQRNPRLPSERTSKPARLGFFFFFSPSHIFGFIFFFHQ